MANDRLRQLLPASFKGIPFFVRNELQTEGGRRIILHDYPNSSDRYIEDMGQIPPNFKITAFVFGHDFLNRADQLEVALKEVGVGVLQMPTFGTKNVYALPYQMDATQKAVGEIRFELNFVSGRATSGPVRAKPTQQTVYVMGDTAREEIGVALEKKWFVPEDTTNVQAAIFDLGQMTQIANVVISTIKNPSDLESTIKLILSNAPTIVRSGELMKSEFMQGLWQKISTELKVNENLKNLINLTQFGANLTLSLSDVYSAYDTARDEDFNYGIPTWPSTTSLRRARNTNRLNLVNSGRVAALATAYEQASAGTYSTDVEINEAQAIIEVQHNRLMRVDTIDADIVQSDPSVRKAMEELRLASFEVLEEKRQSAYKLKTINNPVAVSCFVQAYQLYGEEFETSEDATDRGIEIRELNPTLPADRLIGETTVLQA